MVAGREKQLRRWMMMERDEPTTRQAREYSPLVRQPTHARAARLQATARLAALQPQALMT